jgi:hypothetical protein
MAHPCQKQTRKGRPPAEKARLKLPERERRTVAVGVIQVKK